MSQFDVDLGSRRLVVGYDPPFATYYAQLWDREHDPDFEFGAPARAAGYHPAEKVPPYAGEYGPYPLLFHQLMRTLRAWGVDEHVPPEMRTALLMEAPS